MVFSSYKRIPISRGCSRTSASLTNHGEYKVNSTCIGASFRKAAQFLSLAAAISIWGCSTGGGTTTQQIAVQVAPQTASVSIGMTQQFTATVTGTSNTAVTWQVNGVAGGNSTVGTISTAGLYTAPAAVPSPASVTINAVAQADATKSGTATVTITLPIGVTVSPKSVTIQADFSQQFTPTVTNTTNTAVTWQVNGVNGGNSTVGTISASGLYTAPAAVPNPATVTIKVISQADNTKFDTATVTVNPPVTVSVSPKTANVTVLQTQQFTATVGNTANTAVTWQVNGVTGGNATVGTISATGLYTAPAAVPNPASVTIKAISQIDNQRSDTATATVIPTASGISVSVTPVRGGLTVNQTLLLTPTVTGDALNQGVSWSFSSTGSTTGGSFSSPTSASGTPVTFTAPSGAGVVTITASSVSDLTKTASATIGVTDLPGVFTYHNDNARDGVNSKEYALTTANVNPATFGKLFSCNMDGAVYAQPLWVANVNIGGGKHNVILAVSMRDTVYVFDADASPCVQYWSKSMLPTGETYVSWNDVQTADIFPDIGILGTPVIDPSTNAVYLVAKSKTTSGTTVFHQRLHALNLVDGSERTNSPLDLTGSITYPGSADVGDAFCPNTTGVPFCPLFLNQRSGLALDNGVVYAAWASHGDNQPYHGWVLGFSTSNLAKTGAFNSTPNSGLGGIWMAGGAPAIDASHNLYAITGNGNWDGNTEFGDSLIKLNPSVLTLNDYFTPHGQDQLTQQALDFGSGGAVVLADTSSPTHPHLIIGGGKGSSFNGELYILNRDTLGHNVAGDTQIVQLIVVGGGLFSTEAYWNNTIYVSGTGTPIKAYTLNTATGLFDTSHVPQTPSGFNFPGATPSISATGTTNGIVWALDTSNCGTRNNNCSGSGGPAILHAYDASNVATELWNSSMNAADTAGVAVKFVVPTVANGKVYVSTRGDDTTAVPATVLGRIDVYGLKPN